jgi:DNA-binding LacI/PurR family transcriptional regulator
METALELGYRHNELARSVASGKSRMIGYLVEEPRYEPYWNTIIGALDEAEELGFTLKVLSVNANTLAQRIQQCIELRLGGMLVRYNHDKAQVFQEAASAGIPVVTVDESVAQPFGIRVAANDAPGFRGALSHLVELGHRRIGFIGSNFPTLNHEGPDIGSARETLFVGEMAALSLRVPRGYIAHESMLVYGDRVEREIDDTSAMAATNALLEHPAGRPTAILCWRDETALAAIRACRLKGLRVPGDVSIVGFSDINAARLCDPPLSTVKAPWDAMGRTAVRQLVHNLRGECDLSPQTFLLASEFVARQSTGPATS